MESKPASSRMPIVDLRRRELIASAMHVISTQGIEGATVRDIARVAGASVGSVNYYFPSKDDLLRTAITETDAGFRALVRDAVESAEGCPAKLERVVDMCFPADGSDGFDWPVFVNFWNQAARHASYREIFEEAHREWIDMLVQILAEGVRDNSLVLNSSPEDEAFAFAALIEGLGLYTVVTDRIKAEAARGLAKGYIDALRRTKPKRRNTRAI